MSSQHSHRRCNFVASLAVATLILGFGLHRSAHAAPPSCRTLPHVAWTQPPGVELSLLGVIGAGAPAVQSVKDLYVQAMCGADPVTMWGLVESGQGKVLKVPASLASGLDASTPYFPRVDYMYVRGGGPNRELIAVLLANGYQGPVFTVDSAGIWNDSEAKIVESYWNALPYEYVHRASTWLHDVAKYDKSFSISVPVHLAFGLINFDVGTGYSQENRGLANPLGSLLAPTYNIDHSGSHFWVHELAHYNNFAMSGVGALVYADEFAQISRDNQRVLGVSIPLLFVEKYPQSRAACVGYKSGQPVAGHDADCVGEKPFGYVTNYAACGEAVVEDFGDTLSVAMGASWGIWNRQQSPDGVSTFADYRSNPSTTTCTPSDGYGSYALDRLFGRSADADVDVMNQKLAWMSAHFGLSMTHAQDADGDRVTWTYGDVRGRGDCSDINPVTGTCAVNSCDSADDCNDHNSCTVDSCDLHTCKHAAVDSDGDGAAPLSCGGLDCNDHDAGIGPEAVEVCGDGIDNDCRNGVDDSGAVNAQTWFQDNDHDGYGAGPAVRTCNHLGADWVSRDGDCKDARPDIHPGAVESCGSSEDLNCDDSAGGIDADGDGYRSCQECDDTRADVHPGAVEICDRVDNDCNNVVDDHVAGADVACNTGYPGVCSSGAMVCRDGAMSCQASILPGTQGERCDGLDNDCDNVVDDNVRIRFYRDADGDGYGDPLQVFEGCGQPAGYVTNGNDCYDHNAQARPGQTQWFAADRGDGLFDYDCDGFQLPHDGYVATRSCDFDACRGSLGWEGRVAQCGATEPWMTGCWGAVWVCTAINFEQRQQSCR
jgi:hypothetical protein